MDKNINRNSNVFDTNHRMFELGDDVSLFGMIGHVTFECGAYGIALDEIDWELIESKIEKITGCDNRPYFCHNDNYISFWELIWNFNCEENVCDVVERLVTTEN